MEISQHARYTCTFCGKVRPSRYRCNVSRLNMPYSTLGLSEEDQCRNLELRIVQKSDCWWSMDCINNSGSDCTQVRRLPMNLQCRRADLSLFLQHCPSSAGTDGGIELALSFSPRFCMFVCHMNQILMNNPVHRKISLSTSL